MRKRQTFGWILMILGVFILFVSILGDHHIHLGPLEYVYRLFDWFSIGAFFELVFKSFRSILQFISQYFWCLLLILLGLALIYGAKRQKDYDEQTVYGAPDYKKILCRNLDDMKLAGVCSGLAERFQVDPTIVRIIVLFLGLTTGGWLLVLYLVLALLLPGEHLGRH